MYKRQEYEALNSRIGAILGGEDTELARQLQEYLSALMDMPDTNSMAMGDPSYIYFDLAAGNVTIGKSTYTGYVFVDGAATEVKGTHGDSNKYYVYQSTDVNKADTGYATVSYTHLDVYKRQGYLYGYIYEWA